MAIKLYYFLALVFVFSIFNSCKKYEEGTLINFESRCKRLGKNWKLKYLYVGGIDSTSYFTTTNDSGFRILAITIPSKEGDYNPCYAFHLTVETIKNELYYYNVYGNKTVSDDKKSIKMSFGTLKELQLLGIKPVGPFFTGEYLEFKIKRLTKHELWLDIDYKGNYCWMHFEH